MSPLPTNSAPGIYVYEVAGGPPPMVGASTSTPAFLGIYTAGPASASAKNGEPVLCTNFTEFKSAFGGFTGDYTTDDSRRHSYLAHAVQGFFNNGGARCYVVWVDQISNLDDVLLKLEGIDEISMVAAPGAASQASPAGSGSPPKRELDPVAVKLKDHCAKAQDRVAILDPPEYLDKPDEMPKFGADGVPLPSSDYAAIYYPWVAVFDPEVKDTAGKKVGGTVFVPPSGHVCGVYARVDNTRGVHKAPANEALRGVTGVRWLIGASRQDSLNPLGVNCIRDLNGGPRIWGARTLADVTRGEWKYVNVRRFFCYLRKSLLNNLGWAVFEPNNADLWARVTRNVTAFLTQQWAAGAIFGQTPQEAFYVKCDAETNPPSQRDAGLLVTEVGVAVSKPAEFVVFNISQWQGPAK